jgi:hypothetical protein
MCANEPKHFSVRTSVVLLIALLASIAAGYLFFAGTASVPLAVLTGFASFAGTWTFVDRLIH